MSSKENDTNGLPPMTDEDRLAASLQQGHAALSAGMHQQASEFLEEALILARNLGDDPGEASASGLLAQVYLRLDEPEEAARLAQEALNIAAARKDEAAAQHFQSLLVIARAEPEQRELSTAFGDGRQALTDEDPERALPILEHALELAVKVGNEAAEGAARLLLAQALAGVSRQEEAVKMATEGRTLAEDQGQADAAQRATDLLEAIESADPSGEGIQSEIEQGKKALEERDLERGLRHFERARDQAREMGEPVAEAAANGLLAQTYIEAGRLDEAKDSASRAVQIAESLGHEEAADAFRGLLEAAAASEESHALTQEIHLGSAALESNELEQALTHLERAYQQASDSSHDVAKALAAGLLARTLKALDRLDQARGYAREALEISQTRGEEKAIAHFKALLDELEDS